MFVYLSSKDVKLHIINLLKTVLNKSIINDTGFFGKLYSILMIQIYDVNKKTNLIIEHEELKLSVMQCLKLLFKKSSREVIISLYSREYAAKLSQSILLCLAIANYEKYLLLRVEAIEALMTISYVHDESLSEVIIKNKAADIMMLFLPGIVKTLQDITQGSDVQNHKITQIALRALGRIVTLVMEDSHDKKIISQGLPTLSSINSQDDDDNDDPLGIKLKRNNNDVLKKHIETSTRDEKFIKAAAEKLKIPLNELANLTKHDNSNVRLELVATIDLFLTKTTHNMSPCFSEFIEIIITLSEDDSDDVKNSSRNLLKKITKLLMNNYDMRTIIEKLEENFYKLLTKLPRLIRRSNDSTQLSYLNKVCGYLRLLGKERLPKILISISHLRKLILSLVYIVELDCSDVTVLEDNQIRTIEDMTYLTNRSWKQFKFLRDKITQDKFLLICKYLCEMGDLSILIDSIIETISDTPRYSKELTFLLNCILQFDKNPSVSLYQQVIDYYTDSEYWYLSLQVDDNTPLVNVQSNVIQTCLLTEGLGIISTTLKHKYQTFLLKTLYIIIERAGSGHGLISLVGLQSLEKISQSQGHSDISNLLRENVDYVSYHVTMKLRKVEKYPGVLDVVTIVMKYSTLDFLPCLKEIVEDALTQLAISFKQKNSYSLLKVLNTFVICIRQLVINNGDDNKLFDDKIDDKAEVVIKDLLNYYEAKKNSQDFDNDDLGGTIEDIQREIDENKNDNYDYENIEEENKEPPTHIKLIEDVIKRCLHFLPSKDIPITLLAMQTLDEGLHILANWNDQLLPIVHELWHPLVDRFKESNILITNRAWQLLVTLAKLSQDFIRSRTLKQVLPSISKFLKTSAIESYKKSANNPYKFTQMFKLQRQILSQFSMIANDLKVHEKELWDWLGICEAYLSDQQHPELQDYCINMYKNIANINSDIVWVKCLSIINLKIKNIPSDSTLKLSDLRVDNNCKNEFSNNIYKIIDYVHEITYKNSGYIASVGR